MFLTKLKQLFPHIKLQIIILPSSFFRIINFVLLLNSYGFEKPSAIQQRAIKPVIDGRDTIGQAQSGTGKTATFVIGAVQNINPEVHATQALILVRFQFR